MKVVVIFDWLNAQAMDIRPGRGKQKARKDHAGIAGKRGKMNSLATVLGSNGKGRRAKALASASRRLDGHASTAGYSGN
jgi:hypothetical protein